MAAKNEKMKYKYIYIYIHIYIFHIFLFILHIYQNNRVKIKDRVLRLHTISFADPVFLTLEKQH